MDDRKPRNLLNVEASPSPVYLAGGSCGPGREHLIGRPRGFVVYALPRGFVTFRRPGGEIFFSDGIWYSRRGRTFWSLRHRRE